MDAKDFYIVPVFGGVGNPSRVPLERIYKGGYTTYKDAYPDAGDTITYIKRTFVPDQQMAASKRMYS